jgi:hypothetical protein
VNPLLGWARNSRIEEGWPKAGAVAEPRSCSIRTQSFPRRRESMSARRTSTYLQSKRSAERRCCGPRLLAVMVDPSDSTVADHRASWGLRLTGLVADETITQGTGAAEAAPVIGKKPNEKPRTTKAVVRATCFEMTTARTERILHSFSGGATDGANPFDGLTQGAGGSFYGVTYVGGLTCLPANFTCGVPSRPRKLNLAACPGGPSDNPSIAEPDVLSPALAAEKSGTV